MPRPDDRAGDAAALLRHGVVAVPLAGGPAELSLWLIDGSRPLPAATLALLSVTERERSTRFRTAALRGRYVAAHAALRLLAERRFGVLAACQRWQADALGKPRLVDVPTAQCSLSYAAGQALIAWSEGGEVGVDIEALRPIADVAELATIHYTPAERGALAALEADSAAFDHAFLTVWVRKEACVKALGEGLRIPLDTVQCGSQNRNVPVQVGDRVLDIGGIDPASGFVAAWARCRRSALLGAEPTGGRITSPRASRAAALCE